jgi:signal peptidase
MTTLTTRRAMRLARVRRWYDSPWRIAGRALVVATAILLIAVIALVAVVPRLMGGTSLTVLSGSMEPALAPGDLVAVRGLAPEQVCAEVGVGDIVTFMPAPNDPTLITHRVVAKTIGTYADGSRCRLVTQGDANSAADEPISPMQVRASVLYGLPKVGLAREWIVEHPALVLAAAGAGVVGWMIFSGLRPPRRRVVVVQAPGDGETTAGVHR